MRRWMITAFILSMFFQEIESPAEEAAAPAAVGAQASSPKPRLDQQAVIRLVYDRNFKELEKEITRRREDQSAKWSSSHPVSELYTWMNKHVRSLNQQGRAYWLELLQRWKRSNPESPYARIALASAHVTLAWVERGSGWAYTVSKEGWEGFNAELAEAQKILDEAEKFGLRDPEMYADWITVGMGQSQSNKQMDENFRKGAELDPYYPRLYEARLISLLPRWYGEAEDPEKFARRAAELTREKAGESYYARVAFEAFDYVGHEEFMNVLGFDWESLQKGLDDWIGLLQEGTSQRAELLNFYALLSVLYKDRAKATQMLKRLGDLEPNMRLWQTPVFHERAVAWANEGGDYPSSTPLHAAASRGDIDEAKKLLNSGAKIDEVDAYGKTPMINAIDEGQGRFVSFLLERGADPNKKDGCDAAPIVWAAYQGHADICEALLDYKADVDISGDGDWAALTAAAAWGKLDVVDLLINRGANIEKVAYLAGYTPLYFAAQRRQWHVIPRLLKAGANPNVLTADKGMSPLKEATRAAEEPTVLLLIEHGADPNLGTPLLDAASTEQWEIVRILLDRGANPNATGQSGWGALVLAAQQSRPEAISMLLDKGAKANTTIDGGWTPLHFAARVACDGCILALIEVPGIDFSAKLDKSKETPLHLAAASCKAETVKAMIDKGADPNARDGWGSTVTAYARREGNRANAEYLKSLGYK